MVGLEDKVLVGEFENTSGEVLVTFPRSPYTTNWEWSTGKLKAKQGKYNCYAKTEDNVKELIVLHESLVNEETLVWIEEDIELGLDSDNPGVFDTKVYRNDESVPKDAELYDEDIIEEKGDKWYCYCCASRMLNEEMVGTIVGGVSYNTCGSDGGYVAYTIKNHNEEVVGIKLTYVPDKEEM